MILGETVHPNRTTPADRVRLPEIAHSPVRSRAVAVELGTVNRAQKAVRGKASPERQDRRPEFDASPVHVEETTRQRRQQDVSMTLSATSRSADPGMAA